MVNIDVKSLEFRMGTLLLFLQLVLSTGLSHKRPPTHTCAITIICEIKDKKIKPLLLRS